VVIDPSITVPPKLSLERLCTIDAAVSTAAGARFSGRPIASILLEQNMNNDIIKGKWAQLHGKLKEQWSKLTDDDVNQLDGHREYLVGKRCRSAMASPRTRRTHKSRSSNVRCTESLPGIAG